MALIKVKERGRETVNLGRRNLIINGAMQISQRGTASGITSGSSNYGPDRFRMQLNDLGTWEMSQSTTVPSGEGFTNSLKLNCTTADTSVAAGSYFLLQQVIEGKNVQHLGWGTSSAKNLTWSFWIRSTKTGVVSVEFQHQNSSGNYYTRSSTFTISASNTWEKKIITVPSNTALDIENDATDGLYLTMWFTAGSNWTSGTLKTDEYSAAVANTRVSSSVPNHADSTSNEIYLTGVQCEVGNTATEFEHRFYGEELELCKRYFYKAKFAHSAYGTTSVYPEKQYYYPTEMRANPTISITGGTASNVASQSVRYNLTGGFAHNMGPSSNGMMYIGGGGNACDITFTAEL